MRFVNDYFNDAANAAVAFSFHRGFVAVVSSRYKKKKKSKYRAAIIVVWYCFIP